MKLAIVVFCLALVAGAAASFPSSYDTRSVRSGCGTIIRNQQRCGSCWAFSSTHALSDRMCTTNSNWPISRLLSPEDLLSCDKNCKGCDGGLPLRANEFMTSTGVTTQTCNPYTSGSCQEGTTNPCAQPACPTGCTNAIASPSYTKYRATRGYLITNGDISVSTAVSNIKSELMQNGPVVAAIWIPKNFFTFFNDHPDGTYSSPPCSYSTSGCSLGGHAVRIVGWSGNAWVIANSWGTSWGNQGYFKIAMGNNVIGVELGLAGVGVSAATAPGQTPAVTVSPSIRGEAGAAMMGAWVSHQKNKEASSFDNMDREITSALERSEDFKKAGNLRITKINAQRTRVTNGVQHEIEATAVDSNNRPWSVNGASLHMSTAGGITVHKAGNPQPSGGSTWTKRNVTGFTIGCGVGVLLIAAAFVVVRRQRAARAEAAAAAAAPYTRV